MYDIPEIDLEQYHQKAVEAIAAKFTTAIDVVAAYPVFEDVIPKAITIELDGFTPGDPPDTGTEQFHAELRFVAYVVIPFTEPHHKRLARQLGARLAGFLHGERFGCPGAGPARVIGGNPDEFSMPGKTGRAGTTEEYEVFRVEWSLEAYLGPSVWIDDGSAHAHRSVDHQQRGGGADHMSGMHPGEIDRRLSNTVLIGTVSHVEGKRYKVTAGNITTDWLRYGGTRAGALRMWSPLTVGEQVVVLSPSGDLAQGVIVASIESNAFPSPGSDGQTINVIFPDGSTLDFGGGTLSFETGAAVKIKAASIEMEAGSISIKGPVDQSGGDITAETDVVGGGISLKTHTHGGVQSGGSATAGPT